MTDLSLNFAPLASIWLIATLGVIGLAIGVYGLVRGAAGSLMRSAIAVLMTLALANPSAVSEERQPLKDVAVLLVDETPSKDLSDRSEQTSLAVEAVTEQLEGFSNDLEVRVVRLTHDSVEDAADGSRVLEPLQRALADVPPRRVAGTIMITDGQIHDLDGLDGNSDAAPTGISGPVHSLLTGAPDEADRRLSVVESPSFGLVGEEAQIGVIVEDPAATAPRVRVTIKVDGEFIRPVNVPVGDRATISIPLTHRGASVIELNVVPGEQEITLNNNKAVLSINGVRDRLRVLLVSGEPHPGERTWRNLLKSDPSVDLVHFTILRPPEKQDGTPIHELSLIAFPTRELFEVKLHEFDLVVFDRFRRRGVLPSLYLSNIVDYVEGGGAFLEAVGPSFAGPYSLFRTPLGRLLPGEPTGAVTMQGFKPEISELGKRHPVTAALPGGPVFDGEREPVWGRWFRQVEVNSLAGQTLMTGIDRQPLLILDRVAEGRVGQLLSDHIWLWARGFEGGGPQRELLRRLAHWLMKEPDLEEEDLRASADSRGLTVTRRSMEDQEFTVEITDPDGEISQHQLDRLEDGVHRSTIPVQKAGIYSIREGDTAILTAVGVLNPLEFGEVAATEDKVKPLSELSDGSTQWLKDGLPRIRQVEPGRAASGPGWIGLRKNGDYIVTGVQAANLLPAPLLLALLIGALALTWRRESR